MTSTIVKRAALELALKRGLVEADGSGQVPADLGDFVRHQLLDLETMHLLEREAELVRVQLDPKGHPEKISVLQEVPGSLGYNEAAIEAVRRSIYAPAILDGKPVAGTIEVRVNFERVSR